MTVRAIAVFFLSLSMLQIFSSGLAAEEGRITLGLTTRAGSSSLPFVIAEEMGFFKREGLNVVVVIMQNQIVVNGVLTRNVDYGGTFSNFVGAALSGLPVRIVMAVMDGCDHILSRKDEITSHMEKKWGIKDGDVREGIYGDIVGLYSRTGIASEEGMKNVLQMVQEARKMKGTASPADITEWSYARRANDELKGR